MTSSQPSTADHEHWDKIILPQKTLFHIPIKELWEYRDLLFIFVHRNFVAAYKQSLLGPFWHLLQPLMTTTVYLVVFSKIANISTDGVPPVIFYFCGITIWQFFSSCLSTSSGTFLSNSGIFSKVYFPRLIMPLASMLSSIIGFGINMFLIFFIYIYFWYTGDTVSPNWHIVFVPVLVLTAGFLGLALGVIVSSLTTQYRDLSYFVGFGIQLLMYASPVIYPISSVAPQYQRFVYFNPMASIIEAFKYAFTGAGSFDYFWLGYSLTACLALLIIATILFNRIENKFIDTL